MSVAPPPAITATALHRHDLVLRAQPQALQVHRHAGVGLGIGDLGRGCDADVGRHIVEGDVEPPERGQRALDKAVGANLGPPHTDALGDGLFELRLKGAAGIGRVFSSRRRRRHRREKLRSHGNA